MAMKNLVEPECGGSNALVGLANRFSSDHAKQQEGFFGRRNQQIGKPFHDFSQEEVLADYFDGGRIQHAPTTFHMGKLLHEVNTMQHPVARPFNSTTDSWSEEFLSNASQDWIEEFSSQPRSHLVGSDNVHLMRDAKWAEDYLDHAIGPHELAVDKKSGLGIAASRVLDSVDGDSEQQMTEFMQYVRGLIEKDNEKNDHSQADEWVEEFSQGATKSSTETTADMWADDYELTENDTSYWEKLQNEWADLASQDDKEHPWLEEYVDPDQGDYQFEKDNPFKGHSNAFEEGRTKLSQGDLISAILLFEEAVQADPNHSEAWQFLGSSQAENEQEEFAIRALNRCLDLQPDNLTARMALAVSYTNESLQAKACESLKAWLQHHPRYGHLGAKSLDPPQASSRVHVSSLMSKEMYNEVHDLLIEAAQTSSATDHKIDADVQVGLGVLFNLSGEYEKAIDCFQTGLHAEPDNAQLWNKLGATLANGGRSEEAVEAYRHALSLNPGFLRARYNLGISCVNLSAYNEAVEHFLTALNAQKKGDSPSGVITTMSDNIWTTLRMALSLMGKPDLFPLVDSRDLDAINRNFNVS